MGADLIVVPTPGPYERLGFQQGGEDFSVDEFVPQLAVEGLHIPVLPGTPRFYEKGCHSQSPQPITYHRGRELRTIIRSEVLGDTPEDEEIKQLVNDVF